MTQSPSINEDITGLSNSSTISELQKRLRSSLENIVDVPDDDEPLVTFPDESTGLELELRCGSFALIIIEMYSIFN